jgi:hypothetical protein
VSRAAEHSVWKGRTKVQEVSETVEHDAFEARGVAAFVADDREVAHSVEEMRILMH